MKHNANNSHWIGALALLVFVLGSVGCSKDFLDRDRYLGSSQGYFYQSAVDAEAATIACYAPLQVEISDGAHFRWYFGDIVGDDADKGGSGDTDEPDLLEFENFFGDPSSGIVLGEWKTAQRITYCNIALENIPGIEMDEFTKLAYLGEAQFLRAYWYFNLVTTFGGFLGTRPLAPSDTLNLEQPQRKFGLKLLQTSRRLQPICLKKVPTAPPKRGALRAGRPMRCSPRHICTKEIGQLAVRDARKL